ncbi:MAG: ferredoxin reductase [Actinomycetota bacterium]|nr:ferredoxin reductase [Actinomycetota bacterium]
MQWRAATVVETIPETVNAVTVRLEVPDWGGHRAGQHVDVRLTAENGYSAQRSYAIASPPGADLVDLTIVRHDQGEVSPYLTTVLDVGDQVELRGPVGGYFAWDPADTGPALLVGGGSGVVPLMAMLRHHRATDHQGVMRLVYSARRPEDLLYRAELNELTDAHRTVTFTLTRVAPPEWTGRRGRVDGALLAEIGWPPALEPRSFVCGPTPFVEAAAAALVGLGHDSAHIRAERLGPTRG